MRHLAAIALMPFAFAVTFAVTTAACDSDGDGTDGPQTKCSLSPTQSNPQGKSFGERCTNDSECVYGECMMPGDSGNITNGQFGFCTRGCDCNDDPSTRVSDADEPFLWCLYPSGFKDHHHVTVRCSNVSDCADLDAGYTECKAPNTGGVRPICHAL